VIDKDEFWRIQNALAKRSSDDLSRDAARLLTSMKVELDDTQKERNQLVHWRGDLVKRCKEAGIPPGMHIIDAYKEAKWSKRT